MLRRLTAAVFSLALSATASAQSASETAVLELFFAQMGATERTYVVKATPVVPRSTDDRLRGFHFERAPDFTLGVFGSVKVKLMPSGEYEGFLVEGCLSGWKAFHAKHPEAKELVALSRVAIRENEAALYVETRRACEDGWGGIFFFERVEDRWRVKEQVGMWIS